MVGRSSLFANPASALRSCRGLAAALLTVACARAHFPFSYSATESIGLVDQAFPPFGSQTGPIGIGAPLRPEYDYLLLQPLVAGYTWQYRGTISNTRMTLPAELKVEVVSATRTGVGAALAVEYTVRHTLTFGSATAVTTLSGVVTLQGDRILTTQTVSTAPGLPTLERTFTDGGLRGLPRRLMEDTSAPHAYARLSERVAGTPTAGLGGEMTAEIGIVGEVVTDLGRFETLPVIQQLTLGTLDGVKPAFNTDGTIGYFPLFIRRLPDVRIVTAYAAEVGPVRYTWTQSEPGRELVSGTLLLVAANFPIPPRPVLQPRIIADPAPQALEPGLTLRLFPDLVGVQPKSPDLSAPSSTPVTDSTGTRYRWQTPRGERWTGSPFYYLPNVATADAGDYRLDILAPTGTLSTAPARVTVTAPAARSRLLNVASRAPDGREADTLIAGIVLTPSPTSTAATRRILFRAVGPTLRAFGVADAEPDPTLVIYDGANREIARCDNWDSTRDAADRVAAAATAAAAFPLPPGSRDAALALDLGPGAYTAHLLGAGTGAPLVGLVEIYDASAGAAGPRIANLSTRCRVGLGDQILIPGIVVTEGSARVLVRALGPALRQYGIDDALPDPELTLYAADGTPVAYTDDWSSVASASSGLSGGAVKLPPSVPDATQLAGAAPLGTYSKDAALVVTVPPGNYTLHVRSHDPQQTGVVMAEVYLLNP